MSVLTWTVGRRAVLTPHGQKLHWREHKVVLAWILAVGALDAVLMTLSGLSLAPWPALGRIAVAALLMLGAAVYGLSGRSLRISATLLATAELLLFMFFGVMLSYLAIRAGMPFVDDRLASWDQALGFDWRAYHQMFAEYPWLVGATGILYTTSVAQIGLMILMLGFCGRLAHLVDFVAGLMITGFVTVTLGALLPALGAHHHFGVPDNGVAFFVTDIVDAHSGALQVLDVSRAQGLVVFPSYHTIISLMIIFAAWPLRYVRYPALAINIALIAGVPIWGSHYLVDIIAATAISAATLLAWRLLWRGRRMLDEIAVPAATGTGENPLPAPGLAWQRPLAREVASISTISR